MSTHGNNNNDDGHEETDGNGGDWYFQNAIIAVHGLGTASSKPKKVTKGSLLAEYTQAEMEKDEGAKEKTRILAMEYAASDAKARAVMAAIHTPAKKTVQVVEKAIDHSTIVDTNTAARLMSYGTRTAAAEKRKRDENAPADYPDDFAEYLNLGDEKERVKRARRMERDVVTANSGGQPRVQPEYLPLLPEKVTGTRGGGMLKSVTEANTVIRMSNRYPLNDDLRADAIGAAKAALAERYPNKFVNYPYALFPVEVVVQTPAAPADDGAGVAPGPIPSGADPIGAALTDALRNLNMGTAQ